MNTSGMNIIDTSKNKSNLISKYNHQRKTSKDIIKNTWLKKLATHLLFPDRGIIWLPKALQYGAKFLKENKDVKFIYVTAPSFTNFLIGLILVTLFNRKLVSDFRDFYVVNGLFKRVFPLNYLDKSLERWAMKKSSALLFISNNMKSVYEKKFSFIKSKSHLIYNGFDEGDFIHLMKNENQPTDKLRIFYAGSLYSESKHPRDIFQLLDILKELIKKDLIDKEKISIKIAAPISHEILQHIKAHSLHSNIILLGVIKREEALIEMQNANLFWHILGNSKQDMGAIPIKTFEYMASENPILFFVPKGAELEKIANEYQLGYVAYLDEKYFEHNCLIVLKAYQEIITEKRKLKFEITRYEKFTRRFQAQQLAKILTALSH
ncbi:MAG: hypothetical protein RIQ33_16 [Bacteroidota bacterium]